MKKVLYFGVAAVAAAMMLASPASAWERRFGGPPMGGGFIRPPPMQFHQGFVPQFHQQFQHFGGGPRWVGGGFYSGGVIIQPQWQCTDALTGVFYHYGLCDGTEGQPLVPDGD